MLSKNPADWNYTPRRIRCLTCRRTFVWTIKEQIQWQTRGWQPPKRCLECRRIDDWRRHAGRR